MKQRITILLLTLSVGAIAQVPGYMGKRFSIGYSNYFMLSAIGPTANADNADGTVGINTTHCLNLEYAIKRRTNFCFTVQTGKTGMDPGGLLYVTPYNFYNGSSNYTYTYGEHPFKPMQIRSVNIGLGFKFFQQGTLAPIGKYKKIEALWMVNHLTYKSTAFTTYYGSTSQTAALGTGDYVYNTIAFTYTMGRSRVLFDKMVLDYGIRFGVMPAPVLRVVFAGFFYDLPSSSNAYYSSTYYDDVFKTSVNNRLFRSQLFNFHIGLSFLAF
jgi:hypothetical protein